MTGYGSGGYGFGSYGGAISLVPQVTYRYITADMATGVPFAELPLKCQNFSQLLSGTGSLTATLALGDVPAHVDWHAATLERHTTINVLRDEDVVWAGPIMKNRPTNNGRTAEITAETWEGYLARRRIKTTAAFVSVDVFDIVRSLLTSIQTVIGGNVRMAVTAGTTAGYTQTVTYDQNARPKLLDEIIKLSQVAPHFEFFVTVARDDNGVFNPTLNLRKITALAEQPPIVAQFPGNVRSYEYPSDGASVANAITGIGKGDSTSQLLVEVIDTSGELASGYPIFEDELSLKDEADITRLTALTQTELAARLVDYVVPIVVMDGDSLPTFGSYPLGIGCQLRATSLYHPSGPGGRPGLIVSRRVTGWTVTPSAAGQQEVVQLALATGAGKVVPQMDRFTFARYLASLEKRVRTMEIAR